MNDTADELKVILSEAPTPPPVEELREKLFHELMPLTQYSPDQSRLYTERILKLLATPAVSNADDADRRRLDWLETKGKFFNPRRHIEGYESITRDAIDAAMEATK